MLSSVLPGIRELRAPLAAGFIWLTTLWLVFANGAPTRDEAQGVYEATYRLGDALSAIGLGVVASFVAYLLGSLSQAVFSYPLGLMSRGSAALRRRLHSADHKGRRLRFRRRAASSLDVFSPCSSRGRSLLQGGAADRVARLVSTLRLCMNRAFESADDDRSPPMMSVDLLALAHYWFVSPPEGKPLQSRLSARYGARNSPQANAFRELAGDRRSLRPLVRRAAEVLPTDLDGEQAELGTVRVEPPTPPEVTKELSDLVVGDFDLMRTRLLKDETQALHAAIDRHLAEAEFRFAIAPPLAALLAVLSVQDSWFWATGLVAVGVLLRQGFVRRQQGGDMLIDAIGDHVESPTLETLDRDLDEIATAARDASQPRPEQEHSNGAHAEASAAPAPNQAPAAEATSGLLPLRTRSIRAAGSLLSRRLA
jgi:hypothetical protein